MPNVLVFLTDGHQTDELMEKDKTLKNYSKPLIDAGVAIMAVGFKNASDTELEMIASSPENVISHTGMEATEALTKAVERIVEKLCNCKYSTSKKTFITTKNHWFKK